MGVVAGGLVRRIHGGMILVDDVERAGDGDIDLDSAVAGDGDLDGLAVLQRRVGVDEPASRGLLAQHEGDGEDGDLGVELPGALGGQ